MSFFEIADLTWNSFEETYNIPRTEIVEVSNIFRHICRLFVHMDDLELWDTNRMNVTYYHITAQKIWQKLTYAN